MDGKRDFMDGGRRKRVVPSSCEKCQRNHQLPAIDAHAAIIQGKHNKSFNIKKRT